MAVPAPEPVEVLYYDPEFRRLHRLETCVPEVGQVVETFRVRAVKFGPGQARFRGLRMVYVYLESTGAK